VIEQHDAVLRLERGRDEPPHVLVAAEPVREHHRPPVGVAGHDDVVAREDVHPPRL
jgi:hypothetical protein